MWATPNGYYNGGGYTTATNATYASPAAYMQPPAPSPRPPTGQYGMVVPTGFREHSTVNPNCAGNDVGACIGRCHMCNGGCGRNGHKCMACVGGCQGLERAGYCLGHPLCEGRYGFVRTATKDGKTYAMKVIPIEKFTKSEIELQTLLPDHPHIVQVYEAFKTENVIILVLEYCQHGDLFEHMQKRREEFKGRPMDEDQVRNFFLQILSPVRDLHQLRVAHHDIKLENYLLTYGKMGALTMKLADFGAAEKLDHSSITTCRKGHISPEKKNYIDTGRPYCAFKSDLYQLGSALHEVAFEMREPRPDGSINPPDRHHPSAELQDLLTRLLSLDPSHRISMDEVLRHPWVTKDRSLYEQCLNSRPTAVPLSARNRAPEKTPRSTATTKHEPSATPVSQSPLISTPVPLKYQNGVAHKTEVPRLPLNGTMSHASQPTEKEAERTSTPHSGEGALYRPSAPTNSSVLKGSRITISPRKVDSPRMTSARGSNGAITPRTPVTMAPRPASAAARPITETSTTIQGSSTLHPASPRPASAAAVTTVANTSRVASPSPGYTTTYSAASPYSYSNGYPGVYSSVVQNQYYGGSMPSSSYTMASPNYYTARETVTSPRYYTGAVSHSPYGSSYVLSADLAGSLPSARGYARFEEPSSTVYGSALTPRHYYV